MNATGRRASTGGRHLRTGRPFTPAEAAVREAAVDLPLGPNGRPPIQAIVLATGLNPGQVSRILRRFQECGLSPDAGDDEPTERLSDDPTPEEIARRAASIRRSDGASFVQPDLMVEG